MDDLDLRDTRGRLRRLALAASIAAVVTLIAMTWIDSVSSPANTDPVASSAVPLVAIPMFVLTTLVGLSVLSRRRRPT